MLLDLHMPSKGGLEVLREIREDAGPDLNKLPVVILTSSTKPAMKAINLGKNLFMSKPRIAGTCRGNGPKIPPRSQTAGQTARSTGGLGLPKWGGLRDPSCGLGLDRRPREARGVWKPRHSAVGGSAGRVKKNVLPLPGSESAQIRPP